MDAGRLIDLGDGVYMRPIRAGDGELALPVIQANYDHLRIFMEWAKPNYVEADVRDWIERSLKGYEDNSVRNYGIFRGTHFIGTIGCAYFDHEAKVTEIGYWIDKDEQGKGITGRACRELVDIAFREWGMNRIQIRCADANERSAAIPRKLGFKLEGVQRQHVMRDGKIYDFLIFGLLRYEWDEQARGDESVPNGNKQYSVG